jgi:hypothetical protein
MSLVEWCEATVSRYEYSDYISEFTNSVSNLAFVIVSFYSSGKNPQCDYAICLIGVGSFIFHATESYYGQLLDELPMSLLAYLYLSTFGKSGAKSQSTFSFLTVGKSGAKSQSKFDINTYSCFLSFFTRSYECGLIIVWFVYIKYKLYWLFVSFFAVQISIPLYIVSVVLPKTDQQKFDLAKGAFFAIWAVGCWAYEQYLHSIGQCPTDISDYRFYLHSYWHIGMALAHYQFMQCIDQFHKERIRN